MTTTAKREPLERANMGSFLLFEGRSFAQPFVGAALLEVRGFAEIGARNAPYVMRVTAGRGK
jgi:hypothetical protein